MPNPLEEPKLSERTLWLMAAACGASAANIYYNQPLLGDFAAYFHAAPTAAGAVAVAAQSGYGLGLLFFLPLADLVDRRRLVLLLVTACVVLLGATALAPTLPVLVLLQLLVGTTAMSSQILIPLAVEMSPPRKRGHVVGILMGGLLGGILLARTLSGIVGDHGGWRAMYALASAMMLVMGLLLRAGLPHRPPMLRMRYSALMLSLWDLARTQPRLWPASLVSALSFGSFMVFWTTLAFLMKVQFHRGASEAGMFGIVGLIGALGAPLAGKLSDRKGVGLTVTLALFSSLVAFALMWATPTIPGLIAGVLLMDLGVQSVQVAEQAKVIALLPHARSRINALYMVTRFIGGAGGSLLGAVAWSRGGWPGVCAAALLMTIAALIIHGAGTRWEADPHPSIASERAASAACKTGAISGWTEIPASSRVFGRMRTATDASSTNRVSIVIRVSRSCAWACVAHGAALSRATGLPLSSPLPTTQSSAFLRTPETPCAYSGLLIRIPSAWTSRRRKSRTAGMSALSWSGLNGGRSGRPV